MKEPSCNANEKNFVSSAALKKLRLDNRSFDQLREANITFGTEWGCCHVSIGKTKVLAQVSCDVQKPKLSRTNEGMIFINAELSPSDISSFDTDRKSDYGIQLNRILEKCFKESKCVDLESLCIVANEKAWNINVELSVLNYDGNVAGCCSVAIVAALLHFKRPDITICGDTVTIHDLYDRDPLPISMHHYPVIFSYALFDKGRIIMSDPVAMEERAADTLYLICVNSYREICGMHVEGGAINSADVMIQCSWKSANQASVIVDKIKGTLAHHLSERSKGINRGLVDIIQTNSRLCRKEKLITRLDEEQVKKTAEYILETKPEPRSESEDEESDNNNSTGYEPVIISKVKDESKFKIKSMGTGSARMTPVVPKHSDKYAIASKNSNDEKIDVEWHSDNSEEDDTVILSNDLN